MLPTMTIPFIQRGSDLCREDLDLFNLLTS